MCHLKTNIKDSSVKQITLILILLLSFEISYSQNDTIPDEVKITNEQVTKITPKQVLISSEKPLLIKNVVDENDNFWDMKFTSTAILAFLGALLGIVLSFITVYDKFIKKSKVFAKIISFYSSVGEFNLKINDSPEEMTYGIRFILKFLINVTRVNLNYTEMSVYVKFEGDKNEYKGRIHSPRNFVNCKLGSDNFKLNLPHNEILYYMSVLEKEKSTMGYLTFIVPDVNGVFKEKWGEVYSKPSTFRLEFSGSDGKTYSTDNIKLMSEKEKYIWEDNIWIRQ